MDWKSAEVRKRLADHCRLYGLHLRDVDPHYTSRQDSRTGVPGIRCVDVPVADFLAKPWWRKQVAQSLKKKQSGKGNARDRYLLALIEKWSMASEAEKREAKPLRIPLKGGELFVPAGRCECCKREDPKSAPAIQADLNAAANIGLRALVDPDFPGKWWHVPCDPKTRKPISDKVKGSILDGVGPLQAVFPSDSTKEPRRGRTARNDPRPKEIVNLWRDPQGSRITGIDRCEIWQEWSEYWNKVEEKVVRLLAQQAGISLE
jgi:hypothetical protein